ncbi:hypothetical protein BJV74DRAFT_952202 [Russula compacta]|nr:hypothetical protein BJV74DRAFT_952202 [Russula compacta]
MSTTSTTGQTAGPSATNFTAIFNAASAEYRRVTRKRLDSHPLADKLDTCDNPEDISNLPQTQAQAFSKFREGDEILMKWLTPTVNILFTLSDTLGEGISLPFSPAKTIFTGIGVLLGAVRDVVASRDMLLHIFERIHFSLQRLKIYTGIPLTNESIDLLGKIMAQFLSILALSTKLMKEGRIRKFLKRLFGRTDVEDALSRLDSLTKEESLMTVARTLEITHGIDSVVRDMDGNVKATKVVIEDIDDNVKSTQELMQGVSGNVTATQELIHGVDGKASATKALTEVISENVKAIEGVTRSVDHNVKATIDVTNELKRNQLRGELRTWLSPPDPSINHNTASRTQHEGTASWFIQGSTFRDWKKDGSLLWIRGNPGAGKSILCSAVIEDIKSMREDMPALIAYYYFDYKDASKRDVRGLLTSVLFQLAYDSDRCWDVLHELHTTCRDGSERPSDTGLIKCLKTMLELPGQVPIFIIMDALDECPSNTGTPSAREEVLELVEDFVGANYLNLFICVTSRPEQDIQTVLNPLTSPGCRVSLHEEGGQREDINSYVRSFVQKDRSMRRWREDDKELVITVLPERAGGMFRWVYCQLDTLRRCMPSSIRKALDDLPTTLDDTYERVLQEIPKEKQPHAHRLFQCLVTAIRPLRVEELGEMFAIEWDADIAANLMEGWRPENPEEALLSACSTLITVIDDSGSKLVQFSHFSVKEFLVSDRLRTSEIGSIRHYHILLDAAHTILARACVAVLLQFDESVDKQRLATFPLAFYAAEHWVDHARFGDVESQIRDAMEHLFDSSKPYLAAWACWIYDVDGGKTPHSIDDLPEHRPQPAATALYYAALCGLSGVAKHLIITREEDVNAMCGHHGTPLHAASYEGHPDAIRLLLDHGADVNMIRNESKRTPMWSAYDGGHLEVMRLLLEHGANVDMEYDGYGPLSHDASYGGRAEVLQLLLQHKADVNARGEENQTPLHLASRYGHLKVVLLLLENGADIDALNEDDETPLGLAYIGEHLEVMRLLLERGANVDAAYDRYGLLSHDASYKGRAEVLRLLLQYNADANARGHENRTPLHWASLYGHLKVVQQLLEHGADVNAQTDARETPLYMASTEGYLEVVQLLLRHGADVHLRGADDMTPFQVATLTGEHSQIAQLLLEYGAEKE